MTAQIAASQVVTPAGVLEPGTVTVEGDRIVAVSPANGAGPERILVPGFVDLQVNGAGDVDVWHAEGAGWADLDRAQHAGGVTTWCPTLITAPLDAYEPALARIAAAALDHPSIAGAHLEGPFLVRPGAHDAALFRPPDLDWLDALPEIVRIVTLAPEHPDALDAIALLVRGGVLVGLGHTEADAARIRQAAGAGARLLTHIYNGMPPMHHRQPGAVGAGLVDDRLAVSLIADLVHVDRDAVALAFRAKGPEGVALVTDTVAGPQHAGDGTLRGGAAPMNQAVANVVGHCGVGLAGAVAAASTTPARLLGLTDRGRIEVGARADLVALTPGFEVEATWVGGEVVLP